MLTYFWIFKKLSLFFWILVYPMEDTPKSQKKKRKCSNFKRRGAFDFLLHILIHLTICDHYDEVQVWTRPHLKIRKWYWPCRHLRGDTTRSTDRTATFSHPICNLVGVTYVCYSKNLRMRYFWQCMDLETLSLQIC